MKKVCAHCKRPKNVKEFNKDSSRKDGRCPYCRLCNRQLANAWSAANPKRKQDSRKRWLKKAGSKKKQKLANQRWKKNNRGVTRGRIVAEVAAQGGCGICKTMTPTSRGWDVDHCHRTGKKRGILCHKHNLLLGLCDDSIQILENAIAYLRKHENRIEAHFNQ